MQLHARLEKVAEELHQLVVEVRHPRLAEDLKEQRWEVAAPVEELLTEPLQDLH